MSFQQVPVRESAVEDMVAPDAARAAWTGHFTRDSRFQLQVDTDNCAINVIIKIALIAGAGVSAADIGTWQARWDAEVSRKWNRTFKLCCVDICPNGMVINLRVEFVVAADADYAVQVNLAGTGMVNPTHWEIGDDQQPTHEVGHMLGNNDEYFTVDGVDYGEPYQGGRNVMNDPTGLPAPTHFDLVRRITQRLLGRGVACRVKAVNERC